MNRRKTHWTTAVAASTLLILPLGVTAQTPPPQPKPTTSPQATQPADASQDHLRQAEQALNDISATAVTGNAKSKIADLKQHLNKLQRAASANDKPSATGAENRSATATSGARGNAQVAKEVTEIDKILNELLGPAAATGAAPAPAGTTGTASKPAQSPTLDEATRAKLTEIRTHVTAFAAAMSKSPSPSDEASAAAPAQPPTAATQPPTSSTEPPTTSAQPPPTSTQPPATSAQPPAASAQPPTATEPQTPASQAPASAQGDQDAAKRHLTASREALSQLTQLPAASQLTGEARTQVSQLITNFNELITTGSNWRASYSKVEANVNALIGASSTDEAPAPTPPTGTPGAVGTSGTASSSLDPAIKAKLVEFRNHLKEFEKVAGSGGGSPEASSAAASPASASASSTPPASSASASAAPASAAPMTSASAASASAATPSEPAKTSEPAKSGSESMGKDDAMKHIQAIEAILTANAAGSAGATAATTGTTGTSAAAAGLVLDKAQVEQLKTHLAELKRLIGQKE